MFLHDRWRPITDTVGLFRAGVERCAAEYVAWMTPNIGPGSTLESASCPTRALGEQLSALCPLMRVGQTRVLLVPCAPGWTACFTNGWRGTDVSSIVPMLSVRLDCSALRVTCIRDVLGGSHRRYGARIVALHRGRQSPARVVSVANDGGRWVCFTHGEPLAEEESEWLSLRAVRDRFSAAHLGVLVDRIVPGVWETDAWPTTGAMLVERIGRLPRSFTEVDLEDVQRDIPEASI